MLCKLENWLFKSFPTLPPTQQSGSKANNDLAIIWVSRLLNESRKKASLLFKENFLSAFLP